ncbi:MAG TPA: hypothetical protein VHP34_05835 [Alphaproteobacteria bacterium]|jgi:hypothetical protein|nr:hypothetical protein [Alphaproteobacteria bacterium]
MLAVLFLSRSPKEESAPANAPATKRIANENAAEVEAAALPVVEIQSASITKATLPFYGADENLYPEGGLEVVRVCSALSLGFVAYAWWAVAYVGGTTWFWVAGVAAFVIVAAFVGSVWSKFDAPSNNIRLRVGAARLRKRDVIGAACGAFLLFWAGLYSTGAIVTSFIGSKHKETYAFAKKPDSTCIEIDNSLFARMCLIPPVYDGLPARGTASFVGKKTWFGAVLDDMDAGF